MNNFISNYNIRNSILSSPKGGLVDKNKAVIDHYYKNIYVHYAGPNVWVKTRLFAAAMPVLALADVGLSLVNRAKADFSGYLLNLVLSIKMLFLSIITWPIAIANPSLIYGNSLESEKVLKKTITNYLDENFESNPRATLQRLYSEAGVDPKLVEPLINKLLSLNNDAFKRKSLGKNLSQIVKNPNAFKSYLAKTVGLNPGDKCFEQLLSRIELLDPNQVDFSIANIDKLRPEGINDLSWRKTRNFIERYLAKKFPQYLDQKYKNEVRRNLEKFCSRKAYNIAQILKLDVTDIQTRQKISQWLKSIMELDPNKFGYQLNKSKLVELIYNLNNTAKLNAKDHDRLVSFVDDLLENSDEPVVLQNKNELLINEIANDYGLTSPIQRKFVRKIVRQLSNLDKKSPEYKNQQAELLNQLKNYELYINNGRSSIEFISLMLCDLVFNRAPISSLNEDSVKLLSNVLEIRSPFIKEAVWDLIKSGKIIKIEEKNSAYETLLDYFAKNVSPNIQNYIELGKGLDYENQKAYLTLLYKLTKSEFSSEQKDSIIQKLKDSTQFDTDIKYLSTLVSISDQDEMDAFLKSNKPLNDSTIFQSYFEKIVPGITPEQCAKLLKMKDSKALLLYGKRLEELPIGVRERMKELYKEALLAVINNQFSEFRHNTPHLNALDKSVVDKWKVNHSYKIHELAPNAAKFGNYTIAETENLIDILTLGTSLNTCMHLDGRLSRVKCLQGFLIDGKYHTIAVHGDKGEVIAECQMVLLWDESNEVPVILLENPNIVGNSLEIKNAMIEFAKRKAKDMGLTLLDARMIGISSYKGKVVSRTSNAIFEFVDHKVSVIAGPWSVSNPRVIPT